jgi:hypothetical protein
MEIIRTTLLIADPVYIRARLAPVMSPGVKQERADAVALTLPRDLRMTLFPDVSLTLQREAVAGISSLGSGRFLWTGGSRRGQGNCSADLVAEGSTIKGNISCPEPNRAYYLTSISSNLHRIYEVVMPRDMVGAEDEDIVE